MLNENIKELRKALGLTQQEFAEKIRVKRNTVATYEMGRSVPSDAAISLICREFNVSESWLREGNGEMFNPISRDLEIAAFMGEILKGEEVTFKRRLIGVLARLDESEWELLERKLREIVGED